MKILPIRSEVKNGMLDRRNLRKFMTVALDDCELITDGGSILFITSTSITGMEIFYDSSREVLQNRLMRILPLYLDSIIHIGYICIVKIGKMRKAKNYASVSTSEKIGTIQTSYTEDFMVVTDSMSRMIMILDKKVKPIRG